MRPRDQYNHQRSRHISRHDSRAQRRVSSLTWMMVLYGSRMPSFGLNEKPNIASTIMEKSAEG